DIAVMRGTPRWFLATLMLPETRTTAALVQDIFTRVRQACRELDIALVGGHTEITVGLKRPILSGHMLGEVTRERLVTSAGVQVGQAFGLDPLGTIASGALLAAVPAAHVERAIRACAEASITCYRIGTAVADATELVLHIGTQTRPLPTFTRDEILTLFQ